MFGNKLMILAASAVLCACSTNSGRSVDARVWMLEEVRFFPESRGLTHAEDGVFLPDKKILVGDWAHGLIAIGEDGSTRPFGDFANAGFTPRPLEHWNSPNGISLEPDGRHVLVADITEGYIYRVDTQTEVVTQIHDHPFGVNNVVRDPAGGIWFTQSTENSGGSDSEKRMFAAADRPLADGAVFRIAPDQVGLDNPNVERVVSGLNFANGIVFDARRARLYVAELMANRILSFEVDADTGALGDRGVLADVTSPDNIELDANGDLWVVSPVGNEVIVVDPDTGVSHSVFRPTPDASSAIVAEWRRRIAAGESTLNLLGPSMFGAMPGLLTGVILSPEAVYVSGLGDALVELKR